jgi:ParB/RepB/Spo0J family partition protein
VENMSLKKIHVDDQRGRKDYKNIESLVDSIKQFGIIHPLVVTPLDTPIGDAEYRLVAGGRRFRASLLAGLSEVPVSVRKDESRLREKELELEENLMREDLDPLEEVELVRQIHTLKEKLHTSDEPGAAKAWTQEDTAQLTGTSKSTVSRKIRFAEKLRQRPELKDVVKGLPLNVAIRRVEDLEDAEKLKRVQSIQGPSLSFDYRNLDAREGLKSLKKNSVDLVLTDPPFAIPMITDMALRMTPTSSKPYLAAISEDDNSDLENVLSLMAETIPLMARALKPGRHFYMFYASQLYQPFVEIMTSCGLIPQPYPIIWSKNQTTGAFRGYSYLPCYEPILFAIKDPGEGKRFQLQKPHKAVIDIPVIHSRMKMHPFEKPQKLLKLLIRASTFNGETVLDPFGGSASTLLAAKTSHRRSVGFELNEKNFLLGRKRLEDAEVPTRRKETSDEAAG